MPTSNPNPAPRSTKATALGAFEKHRALHPLAHYTGILSLQGLARLVVAAQDTALNEYCHAQFEPFAAGRVRFPCNFPNYQCGGNGAAFLLFHGHLPEVADAARRYAEQILHEAPRNPDGLVRLPGERTDLIWVDAAFAVVPFLLWTGLALRKDAYVEEACRQALGLCDALRDPANGLLHQSYSFVGAGRLSQDHWSRGNGWGLLALAELASGLPADHARRPTIDAAFTHLLEACLAYQDADGLWHQEITETSLSYVETSGTGLILFALGVAIERNLLPSRRPDWLRGLAGLARYVGDDFSVFHACRDCLSPGDGSKAAYMARPPVLNDPHAFGPVVLAYGQALKLGIATIPVANARGTFE